MKINVLSFSEFKMKSNSKKAVTKSVECFTNKVTVVEPIDHKENFKNVAKVAATFTRILFCALQTNNYKTIHSKFVNLPDSEMTLAVTMIAILPMLVKRTNDPDNLPALYFYGDAGTGKKLFLQPTSFLSQNSYKCFWCFTISNKYKC